MNDVEAGSTPANQGLARFQSSFDNGGVQEVLSLLRSERVSVVCRRSCPYCMEAKRILDSTMMACDGGDVVYLWIEDMDGGSAMLSQMKHELACSTVPMIFIGGEFVGGCDSITKMRSKGELLARVCNAVGGKGYDSNECLKERLNNLSGDLDSFMTEETQAEDDYYIPDEKFYDAQSAPALTERAAKAYPPLFYFPEVVDNNVVRLVGLQVVIVNILAIVWRKNVWTHYMILGLALDNLGRFMFGPGPSPLGQLAKCLAVPLQPSFKPGIPKQFANGCGLSMSIIATVFLFVTGFDSERIIASCFMGVYAALAALEAGINFCMGCYMFGWLVQCGVFPKEIYSLCISSVPEYYYTYEEATKVLELPEPEHVTLQYPGKPKSAIDVKYKTKSNDHDAQSFGLVKYTKASHFSIVLGILGLAALWRLAGNSQLLVYTNTPGDVFAIIGACSLAFHGLLYIARFVWYRNKVYKDWMHPVNSNALIIPPASFVLLAFCTYGRFAAANTLAKVLYWIGAPLTLLVSLVLVARWVTDAHSQEHINAGWLLTPTANFVCALVAPGIDSRYTEAAFLWFSFAIAIAVPIYVLTLQKAIMFNDPDDRVRPLKWGLVAVTAVACIANAFLAGEFTFTSKVLYFISLSLGLMLGCLYLTGHFSRVKFDATSSWMIAFPLEALSLATIVYATNVQGTLPEGMAYAGLAISSWTVATLALQTLFSVLMKKFFNMDPKYGPLSQQILTHEAFRAASVKLKESLKSLDFNSDKLNQGSLKAFGLLFRKFRLAHQWHALHEEKVIFKEFEDYVPGSCSRQHGEHEHDEHLMQRWNNCLEVLESGKDFASMKKSMSILHREIPDFLESFEEHLQGEEKHLQRLGRKQLCFDLQKDMIRRIWNMTPSAVWAEFLPFVIENMPMQQQRVKFVRAFAVWSLPERAQMMGRMIALGVEPEIWERLVSQVPEIAPRGEPKYWKRYY